MSFRLLLSPTIAVDEGDSKVVQCASCGCLVTFQVVTCAKLQRCPACNGGVWWNQEFNVGPFIADAKSTTLAVLQEVMEERGRQDSKWGEQNHPDGTNAQRYAWDASVAKEVCRAKADAGTVTWVDVLDEEIFEAYEQEDWTLIREELLQAAAVLVAWVESGDRNHR